MYIWKMKVYLKLYTEELKQLLKCQFHCLSYKYSTTQYNPMIHWNRTNKHTLTNSNFIYLIMNLVLFVVLGQHQGNMRSKTLHWRIETVDKMPVSLLELQIQYITIQIPNPMIRWNRTDKHTLTNSNSIYLIMNLVLFVVMGQQQGNMRSKMTQENFTLNNEKNDNFNSFIYHWFSHKKTPN